MKRQVITTLAVLFVAGASNAATPSLNILNEVFHHKGKLADKVACYFEREPICTYIPSKAVAGKEGWQSAQFLFPMAAISSPKCWQMIKKINAAAHDHYRIVIALVTTPIKGIALTVQYDAQVLGLEHETFTSIQQQPGILFKLCHKEFLKELSLKSSPVQYYALHKKKAHIVLDFGHGGTDLGKVGCFAIKEKDITLTVGMKVAQLLQEQGLVVFLTRNADRFVSLEERTTFANKVNADLFVSIHANGAPSPAASGIETFCLVPSLFNKGVCAHIEKKIAHVMQHLETLRYQKSAMLADSLHASVLASARHEYGSIPDRKVKKAISQVLLGSEMPAALVEIGFLSNSHEAALLNSPSYQTLIAQGICNGILSYLTMA